MVVLDLRAYGSEFPWTHVATLFLASPKHYNFSIMSSVCLNLLELEGRLLAMIEETECADTFTGRWVVEIDYRGGGWTRQ